jgi:hypothetical protein
VLEAITGVGIGLSTARDWAYIWPLTCNNSIQVFAIRKQTLYVDKNKLSFFVISYFPVQ